MKNPNERARSNMYQHNESFLKRRQKMRCATKTLSNSTSTSSGAVLCRRRRFPLFLFLLLNEWMKNITRFDSLLFIWTPFYVLCAFFLTFDFFEEFLKKFEVWIFENSTFFCEENVTKSKSLSSSSSRIRWWWFGRLLRGSESQNTFDRWSSLKGHLSKSVRLRRGCCVGGDALVVLVVLVFLCVCVRLCRSKRKSK